MRVCPTCKRELPKRPPSQWNRRFCSLKCWYKTIKGSGNPSWRPKARRICKECNKIFYVKRYELKIRPCAFCSMSCRALNIIWREKLSKIKKERGLHLGKRNSNWLGGIARLPYPYKFIQVKKIIRKRDKNICLLCGKFGNHIHHIDYNKKNSALNNLITLCPSCHSRTNFGREKWIRLFKGMFSNKLN